MKKVLNLKLGYSDAQNYLQRGNKDLFSKIFVRNQYLEDLKDTSVYYLIGEKGTGKTAYATFFNNNETETDKGVLKFIKNTDYEKFYELKRQNRIDVSGYVDIWKVILLLLISRFVVDNKKIIAPFNKSNIEALTKAIDKYYNDAFSPEIVNALKIVDKSGVAATLICKYAEASGVSEITQEFTEQRLQMNLFYIHRQFSTCFEKLKINKNLTLFIDGIDVRPSQIPYSEYLDCIRGLSDACWSLNTELFANIKDSKGQVRIVLLLRPDIFNSLNLQNATNKLSDNSVYLEWQTTYSDYETSYLFEMAKKLLMHDQEEKDLTNIWDHYFPWKLQSSKRGSRDYDTAFMDFLKISLSRPRDIQKILTIIKGIMKRKGMNNAETFDYESYNSDAFQNEYSEYFLGSLKDQLAFYYSEEDYSHFLKFFDFFDRPEFSYSTYEKNYIQFTDYVLANAKEIPTFVEDKKGFLQLLYDSNIIAAIDGKGYYHFSYREKSPSNIAPKVLFGEDIKYRFHYGLYKKAHMGRYN